MTNPIQQMRDRFMEDRRVVCTGNPADESNIASGIKRIWPDATFLCRSNGWDLTSATDDQIAEVFSKHNTFINSSYIKPGMQKRLLDICNQYCKFYDVVNIGSTHELTGEGSSGYSESKIQLRNASLEYNTFRFQTTHVILGGVQSQAHPEWLPIDEICKTIKWTLEQNFKVPLISIIQPKEPW